MTNQDETWEYDVSGTSGSRSGLGPAGQPKPLSVDELNYVPGKGNLGGPGNTAANGGMAAQDFDSETLFMPGREHGQA
jgi:hypothetical protein